MTSPSIFQLIQKEKERQQRGIELIASENYVSKRVLQAAGSILTNKYAEGYPAKRYYGGCSVVDEVENLAIAFAQKAFDCTFVNVQPHSGSQANTAVFASLMNPGDTLLGLNLNMGGHLTHGSPVNFSGLIYRAVFYGLDKDTLRVDYEQLDQIAQQEKPKVIVCGASSYPRDWDYEYIRQVADRIGATVVADIAHTAGLIAKKKLNDPFQHCHIVTTTTHKTLRGPRGGMIMMREDFDNPLKRTNLKGMIRPMSKVIDSAIFPGNQGGPLMHIIAAKAVAFEEVLTDEFDAYTDQVITNAQALVREMKALGYNVVSGGTDNHMVLVDLRNHGISGKNAEETLGKIDITVNKNVVPFDDKSPMITSGIRLGTPAVTSRGLVEEDMQRIATYIHKAILTRDNDEELTSLRNAINKWMSSYTIYPEIIKASSLP